MNLFIKCLFCVLFSFCLDTAICQQLNLQGDWNCVKSDLDIIAPGYDYASTLLSGKNMITVDVFEKSKKEKKGYTWMLSIHKSDFLWNDGIRIYCKRLTNGISNNSSYPNSISGGESFMEITNFEQEFFYGLRGFSNIDIQYKFEGISVLIPAEKYHTNIVYTISER